LAADDQGRALTADPINVLRTAVSAAVFVDPDQGRRLGGCGAPQGGAHRAAPTMVASSIACGTAEAARPARGLTSPPILYMMSAPSRCGCGRTLDVALSCTDHELNASTFCAR